jgi:hypothetical protein
MEVGSHVGHCVPEDSKQSRRWLSRFECGGNTARKTIVDRSDGGDAMLR